MLDDIERNRLWAEWLPNLKSAPEEIKRDVFLKTESGCAMCGHRAERVVFGRQLYTYDPCPVCL